MSFFQNTCKPKGFAGKIMVNMMNTGHAALAEWGLTHIKIRDDDFCLDIGCGGGANLKRLLGKSSNGHITGVDYSEVSVQKSKKLNRAAIQEGRCEVLQGNVMNLPFSENTFHLVTAFETIYFWPGISARGNSLDQHRIDCNAHQNEHPLEAHGKEGAQIVLPHLSHLPVGDGCHRDRGQTGEQIYFQHSPIDQNENDDAQRPHGNAGDRGLEPQAEKRP